MYQFVPEHILPKLSSLTPYTLVVLRKGPKYGAENAMEIIQGKHLPYVFSQREEGNMVLTFPVMDNTELAAIAIYNTTNKEEVKTAIEQDPAVAEGVFIYEIVSGVGLKGDVLP